jgi:monoamine oxidase
VHLASGDIANLWAGFFDGAIESGTRVAREVADVLGVKPGGRAAEEFTAL